MVRKRTLADMVRENRNANRQGVEQGRGQQYNEDHSDAEDIQNEQQQGGIFSLM